jgi:hypothetical protein
MPATRSGLWPAGRQAPAGIQYAATLGEYADVAEYRIIRFRG